MNILILSVTSDIGLYLAKKYHAEGHSIYGTYRSRANIERIKRDIPGIRLVYCDFEDGNCIDRAAEDIMSESSLWDILISCPCTPKPLKPFMESDIDEWEDSFYLNSLGQLRFLHRVYEKRNIRVTHRKPMALFFAGGGTNGPVDSFSAYTSAKIHLIKMFELLAHEDKTTKYTIIGPGWTYTKAHYETMKHCPIDSKKYNECKEFMSDHTNGTPLVDIYNCISWIDCQELKVVSGRNFSVVNDEWRESTRDKLALKLEEDDNMYKLRRHGNEWKSGK